MKIALAQIASDPANLDANLAKHAQYILRAAAQNAALIVFPELSLTAYQPERAADAAITPDDSRLAHFQGLADAHGITIGVGVPLRRENGVAIAMCLFQPGQAMQVYGKRYLHEDEEAFFIPAADRPLPPLGGGSLALAICYEISVPQHAQDAHAGGAAVYLASVAKTPGGVVRAHERLAEVGRAYGMTVLMVNCVGECEGKPAGGCSAVWDADGALITSLSDSEEGLLIHEAVVRGMG